MNSNFRELLNKLAEDRRKLLEILKEIPAEKFLKIPGPGKWSLSQVLTHVLTTERLSLIYMKKKSLGVDATRNSGIFERLKIVALIISQRLPLRYKAPKTLNQHTPEAFSVQEIIDKWEAFLIELETFLSTIEDKNVRKMIYKHPVFGRMDVVHAMISMHEHFHHHMPQIKRLMK